jgi:hypothetical protein
MDAIARLSHYYPQRLIDENISAISLLSDRDHLHVDAINLAQEAGIPSILPYLFFLVCKRLMDGIWRFNRPTVSISPAIRRTCEAGWHDIIMRQNEETFKWLDIKEDSPFLLGCQCRDKCDVVRVHLHYRIFRNTPSCYALTPWNEMWGVKLCGFCRDESKRLHEQGRQSIWNDLPSIFGLPEWAELLNE